MNLPLILTTALPLTLSAQCLTTPTPAKGNGMAIFASVGAGTAELTANVRAGADVTFRTNGIVALHVVAPKSPPIYAYTLKECGSGVTEFTCTVTLNGKILTGSIK